MHFQDVSQDMLDRGLSERAGDADDGRFAGKQFVMRLLPEPLLDALLDRRQQKVCDDKDHGQEMHQQQPRPQRRLQQAHDEACHDRKSNGDAEDPLGPRREDELLLGRLTRIGLEEEEEYESRRQGEREPNAELRRDRFDQSDHDNHAAELLVDGAGANQPWQEPFPVVFLLLEDVQVGHETTNREQHERKQRDEGGEARGHGLIRFANCSSWC